MPSKEAHLAAARANQVTIDYLCRDGENHAPWIVTVAFYKALHVIEAVFAADSKTTTFHTDDHKVRNRLLRTTRRYQQLWKMYSPLWQASLIARYLRENENAPTYEVFAAYLPRKDIDSKVLGHYLAQLEKSARRLIGEAGL